MQVGSSIAIYFVIWWLTLFLVLPFGVKSQQDAGEVVSGSEPGAPVKTRMLRIIGLTTVVAALFFILFWMVYVLNVFDLTIIRDIKR